ncbi:hypothetical protein RC54_10550 [Herbaspirillum rubrisubalbicans]|uniref:Uncharacterized protein n=1 Tax=Herbaspirillum rubrisubalbicans TaxID=80842 RepID=A0AAD0U6Y7_9BURK|nr:hypothetical protein RC54_10550 [Herbaspirillum rubrisubalbicans]
MRDRPVRFDSHAIDDPTEDVEISRAFNLPNVGWLVDAHVLLIFWESRQPISMGSARIAIDVVSDAGNKVLRRIHAQTQPDSAIRGLEADTDFIGTIVYRRRIAPGRRHIHSWYPGLTVGLPVMPVLLVIDVDCEPRLQCLEETRHLGHAVIKLAGRHRSSTSHTPKFAFVLRLEFHNPFPFIVVFLIAWQSYASPHHSKNMRARA